MKMPISEIIDRFTITKLKSERTDENVSDELEVYQKEIINYKVDLEDFIERMYNINGKIWRASP